MGDALLDALHEAPRVLRRRRAPPGPSQVAWWYPHARGRAHGVLPIVLDQGAREARVGKRAEGGAFGGGEEVVEDGYAGAPGDPAGAEGAERVHKEGGVRSAHWERSLKPISMDFSTMAL